jgi:hypothetical protein
MNVFVKLEQQYQTAREEYLAAAAEPRETYSTGRPAEEQEARNKASTARAGKKRTLKDKMDKAEQAMVEAKVESIHEKEDEGMRRSAVARGLMERQREMMEMERQTDVMKMELQREMMAASRKRGLMERKMETEAIHFESTNNATRLTNTDLMSSGGPATPTSSERSQPVSPAVQRSPEPQSTQGRKRKSQKEREAEAANVQEQFEIPCAQEVVVDSVVLHEPPPAIETQPPTHSVPLTWKVGVAAIAMIAVLGFAFFQQMKTQEMQHAQEMQEMQQALRDAEARQRLIATEALHDAKMWELRQQLEDASAFSLGGTFQQLLGK